MKKPWTSNLQSIGICLVSGWLIAFALINSSDAQIRALALAEKKRVVLLTDIGGDLDDEQSFTRFLMYADQYDIEGLLATSIRIFPRQKRRPLDGEPQPRYLVQWIKAYADVRQNLLKHSEGWPEPEMLLTMIRKGAMTGRDAPFNIRTGVAEPASGHYPLSQIIGKGKDTGASMHIIEVVDKDDPRPVWVPIWGGSSELAQALWRVRNDRNQEEVKQFVSKLRVYAWGHQDATGLWIQENFPDLFYIVSVGGILYSAEPGLRDKKWLDTHVRFNHGPLGALCPVRKGMLGGADSETFLGLIPTGLSAMDRPDWGGWGGRFKTASHSTRQWVDLEENLAPKALGSTISRWAPDFQNDYQARMDWSVKEFAQANHPPTPVLNGDSSLRPIQISAKPGEKITLDASGSTDIDGDQLAYQWHYYPQAGTFSGNIEIDGSRQKTAHFTVPEAAAGSTMHIILTLRDNGSPVLTRYRRLVVHGAKI